jgi:hypothetical protein
VGEAGRVRVAAQIRAPSEAWNDSWVAIAAA